MSLGESRVHSVLVGMFAPVILGYRLTIFPKSRYHFPTFIQPVSCSEHLTRKLLYSCSAKDLTPVVQWDWTGFIMTENQTFR